MSAENNSSSGAFPDLVYKYRDWSNSFGRRSLTLCEAYFSSSRDFNDPWDCSFDPVFHESDPIQLLERIRGQVDRSHPSWPKGKVLEEVEDVYKNGPWRDERHRQAWISQFREYRASHFGVFSLAKEFNVNLMWSHYAAGHSGYCIGYSLE